MICFVFFCFSETLRLSARPIGRGPRRGQDSRAPVRVGQRVRQRMLSTENRRLRLENF